MFVSAFFHNNNNNNNDCYLSGLRSHPDDERNNLDGSKRDFCDYFAKFHNLKRNIMYCTLQVNVLGS